MQQVFGMEEENIPTLKTNSLGDPKRQGEQGNEGKDASNCVRLQGISSGFLKESACG